MISVRTFLGGFLGADRLERCLFFFVISRRAPAAGRRARSVVRVVPRRGSHLLDGIITYHNATTRRNVPGGTVQGH